MTDRDLRPPQQRAREDKAGNIGTTKWLLIVLGIAALAYGGWWAREHWAAQNRSQAPAELAPLATPAAPAAPVEPPAPSLATAESANVPATPAQPLHPLAPAAQALTADDASSLDRMAREWLGARALQFLVMPGLAHHMVATIDNLPRGHAAPRLWPLSPVGGKLQTQPSAQGGLQIAADNSARYDAVVAFVTGLEPATVVQWYRQAYPVLQQTYEELGYPGQYFNDRLVAVIDHLLQTPQPQEPLGLRLVQVQGQVAPQQPWLRYELADPDLQARSAGQKILLRLGSAHRAAMMAYLQALRAQIAP